MQQHKQQEQREIDMPTKLPSPTKQQQKILDSKAHIRVVIAGPGAGKTTMLAHVVKESSSQLPKDKKVLLLTFSKRTVADTTKRLTEYGLEENVDVMTFHAFGHRLIRRNYAKLDYSDAPTILNERKSKNIFDEVFELEFKGCSLDKKAKKKLRNKLFDVIHSDFDIEAWITKAGWSKWKSKLLNVQQAFVQKKKGIAGFSFNDQIQQSKELLKDFNDVRKDVCSRYDVLLVDELQDLDEKQLFIVYKLAEGMSRVILVGDDAQTIYGYRGAKSQGFARFKKWYKDIEYYKMSKSFRCTQEIIDLANIVRSKIKRVVSIKLESMAGKGDKPKFFICKNSSLQNSTLIDRIQTLHAEHGISYEQMTVLTSTRDSLYEVYRTLMVANIPCLLGNRESLKKTCNILCLMLEVLCYSISEDTKNKAVLYSNLRSLLEILDIDITDDNVEAISAMLENRKPTNKAKVDFYAERLFTDLKKAKELSSFVSQISLFKGTIGYYSSKQQKKLSHAYFNMITSNVASCATLAEVIKAIRDYQNQHEVYIPVQLIHWSKGLEYDAVFIADMVDGIFPHKEPLEKYKNGDKEALQESLKVLYVGITRAKKWLFMLNRPNISFQSENKNDSIRKCTLITKSMSKACEVIPVES